MSQGNLLVIYLLRHKYTSTRARARREKQILSTNIIFGVSEGHVIVSSLKHYLRFLSSSLAWLLGEPKFLFGGLSVDPPCSLIS